jgi:hypothetical protein
MVSSVWAWLLVGWLMIPWMLFGFLSVLPGPEPLLEPAARERAGMVIRDPWYDYGTLPGFPDAPNVVAQEHMGALLNAMGVRWVRLAFHIDGSDADVAAQVARNDYFINNVAPRYNLRVLALLSYGLVHESTPADLVAPAPVGDVRCGCVINRSMRRWLDRARLIANRYRDRIAAYEMFNEPNYITDTLVASPAVIAHLHAQFYHFFHHVDRAAPGDQSWRDQVQIISGGLHPSGPRHLSAAHPVGDRQYLRQMYRSAAFQDYYAVYGHFPLDGVGYHPYPYEISTGPDDDMQRILARLDVLRATLAELGDPHVPFWITEIGYNVAYGTHDEHGQAAWLQQVFLRLAQRDDVATLFWFKYEDFAPADGPDAQQWGVVQLRFWESGCPGNICYEATGRPIRLRPSFWVYQQLTGGRP